MCQFVINSGWQELKNQMCYKIQFSKGRHLYTFAYNLKRKRFFNN